MNKYIERLYNGLIKENPTLVLMLGMCPTLAVSTRAINGIGMGLSTTAVLILSNLVISWLRKVIPDQVRLPSYIVIVASLVTVTELLMEAYLPSVYGALGIYIPLIVVNCIIIGRAEAFCQKNPIGPSFVDGITQGLGYTVVLIVMCVIREFLGSGRFGGGLIDVAKGITLDGTGSGIQLFNSDYGASILTLPVGGFLTLGFIFAAMQAALKKAAKKKAAETDEEEDEEA
jgi:electron transport complex protein RnfE